MISVYEEKKAQVPFPNEKTAGMIVDGFFMAPDIGRVQNSELAGNQARNAASYTTNTTFGNDDLIFASPKKKVCKIVSADLVCAVLWYVIALARTKNVEVVHDILYELFSSLSNNTPVRAIELAVERLQQINFDTKPLRRRLNVGDMTQNNCPRPCYEKQNLIF